jgi:hypothetical protein
MIRRTVLRSAFAFATTLLLSTGADALLFRAYVSSDGNDANPCTLPQPCRLLPAALTAVADGGEIWMLDSANYNTATVTIGKSVSILAVPGAVGSVVAVGGPAISITAAGLTIALRNLVIVPFPGSGATNGVSMAGSSTLTIEGSLIANLPGDAVNVIGSGRVETANTIIRNNAGYAVWLQNGASADISGTKLLNNGNGGILAYSSSATTTTATVSDTIISGGLGGVIAQTAIAGGATRIFVTRCTIQNTSVALDSETSGAGTTLVAVSGSMITNNNFAWLLNGAGSVVRTLGNNHLTDNTNQQGSLTTASLQ